jgi:Putative quorum-sensing-regulated virulence factor
MDPARIFFGQYRGTMISELPTPYLQWLVEECNLLAIPRNEQLKNEIEGELQTRVEANIPAHVKAFERHAEDQIFLSWWLDQGRTWYRRGFPPELPSESDVWIPPYDLHLTLEWAAFQRRKSAYRKRHFRHQKPPTKKE